MAKYNEIENNNYITISLGQDGGGSIATRYRLDSLRIESQWGARYSTPTQTGPGDHPASYTMGIGYFLGVKRVEHDVNHPPPCSAEAIERVEPYIYSPSVLSWPVLELTFLYKNVKSTLHTTCNRVCHTPVTVTGKQQIALNIKWQQLMMVNRYSQTR
jgi:hypothetical protein